MGGPPGTTSGRRPLDPSGPQVSGPPPRGSPRVQRYRPSAAAARLGPQTPRDGLLAHATVPQTPRLPSTPGSHACRGSRRPRVTCPAPPRLRPLCAPGIPPRRARFGPREALRDPHRRRRRGAPRARGGATWGWTRACDAALRRRGRTRGSRVRDGCGAVAQDRGK